MSSRVLRKAASKFSWYHWAGGAALAGGFNAALLGGMVQSYRWWYSDYEEEMRVFERRFGRPTEAQRLEVYTWLADKYDLTIGMNEKSGVNKRREDLLQGASGSVLEVAVGTGRCFEALRECNGVERFVGIDCVEAMLKEARKKAENLPFPVELMHADAHKLPFPDNSFDAVVGTLCLCALERPVVALDEMARVCRPGGSVLLLEPGLAASWPVRVFQRYLGLVPNPKHAWEFGWYDDIDPVALVKSSRLSLESVKTRAMGNWYIMRASPPQASTPNSLHTE
mmetsp:Transcript_62143/g.110888  ORF Transcript_62143/g.110888 Transcript_62143/m.110888 type:complete len:282 (+) Transcript_62143:71-916(+)